MELPLYVYCRETSLPRRRPLGVRVQDLMSGLAGGVPEGAATALGA